MPEEKKKWSGTTYGNGWMHKWLIRMLRYIDLRILYVFADIFIIPVCLVRNPSRGTAYYYLRHRIGYGICKAAWKTYVNHCMFAQVVIDRFAMYAGRKFHIEMEGYDNFLRLADEQEGFIQLSSHIGNYEIAGYNLTAEKKRFYALVFAGEKDSIMKNRNMMFGDRNISMIPIRPDMGHLFEIDAALTSGGTVSMPADRLLGSKKAVRRMFLGAEASFPMGPISVATMRSLSVLAVNVMKTSWNGYKIYVVPLEYDKSAPRKYQMEQLSKAYVTELERIIRMYPEQWYNFFEFWQ